MKYNFDEIIDRRASDSVKWREFPEDVLPLWVADMDFKSPEPVIRAMRERVEHGVFGYPDTRSDALYDGILAWLEGRFGWKVQKEAIVLLPGVATGFNLASQTVGEPGAGLLVQTPVYPPILQAARNARLLRQDAPLTCCTDGSYVIDRTIFDEAMTDHTRVFLLCNPHNPVGRVFTREELTWMAEQCLRRDVVICADEIHGDLVYSGHPHLPIASLDPEIANQTITLMAPSKTFNLAGLKCAFAVIPNAELRRRFEQCRRGIASSWVNLLGLTAARAAYLEGHEWLKQLLVYLEANRDFLYEFVERELPGISMVKPEGTYLAWLDCREAGIEGDPCKFFKEQARVATNDGTTFGPGGEGYVRLNFGCPRSILEEALGRMRGALEKVQR